MSDSKPFAKSPENQNAGGLPAPQPWNEVKQPGAYVCNDTGRLLRVPAAAITNGVSPLIDYVGPQGPARVTRLSENSGLPVAELRAKASATSIKPQF